MKKLLLISCKTVKGSLRGDTEINAVIARNQLLRLDDNNRKRTQNFKLFLENLDPSIFRTDFILEGSVNYALVVILKEANDAVRDKLEIIMGESGIEFRRGWD